VRAGILAGALVAASPAAARAADLANGKALYELRCAPCHGNDGRGDGPAAQAITPKPRNFRDAAFWKGTTREQILTVVRDGRPQTLMAGFQGVLSDAEIDDVIAYLQSFRPDAR
jgi:mono/diheme cytochrome c family protein